MKIIIEVDDAVKNEVGKMVSELSSMTFEQALEEKLKHEIDRSVKVLDSEKYLVITLEELYKNMKFHADAEERGVALIKKATDEKERPEYIRMQEDNTTKQRGFKEAYLEIISKIKGKFETVESLVKEFGDLSGIW